MDLKNTHSRRIRSSRNPLRLILTWSAKTHGPARLRKTMLVIIRILLRLTLRSCTKFRITSLKDNLKASKPRGSHLKKTSRRERRSWDWLKRTKKNKISTRLITIWVLRLFQESILRLIIKISSEGIVVGSVKNKARNWRSRMKQSMRILTSKWSTKHSGKSLRETKTKIRNSLKTSNKN